MNNFYMYNKAHLKQLQLSKLLIGPLLTQIWTCILETDQQGALLIHLLNSCYFNLFTDSKNGAVSSDLRPCKWESNVLEFWGILTLFS